MIISKETQPGTMEDGALGSIQPGWMGGVKASRSDAMRSNRPEQLHIAASDGQQR